MAKAANNVTGQATFAMMDFVQFKDPQSAATVDITPLLIGKQETKYLTKHLTKSLASP